MILTRFRRPDSWAEHQRADLLEVVRRHGLIVRWQDRDRRCLFRLLDAGHRCRAHAPSWHACLSDAVWLRDRAGSLAVLVVPDERWPLSLFHALADEHALTLTLINRYRGDAVFRSLLLQAEADG